MHVRPVDPRDTETEITSPSYRVFFWEQQTNEGSGPAGFTSHEFEVTEAQDVREVLEWATTNAKDRTFTAYVVVNNTLVRLVGRDPTEVE